MFNDTGQRVVGDIIIVIDLKISDFIAFSDQSVDVLISDIVQGTEIQFCDFFCQIIGYKIQRILRNIGIWQVQK